MNSLGVDEELQEQRAPVLRCRIFGPAFYRNQRVSDVDKDLEIWTPQC
jgi:hypothetical protein